MDQLPDYEQNDSRDVCKENTVSQDYLIKACQRCSAEDISTFIRLIPNNQDVLKTHCLNIVAGNGNSKCFSLLIANGAKCNIHTLHTLSQKNHWSCLMILAEQQLVKGTLDPIFILLMSTDDQSLNTLLYKVKSIPESTDVLNRSVIACVRNGYQELARKLVREGGDMNTILYDIMSVRHCEYDLLEQTLLISEDSRITVLRGPVQSYCNHFKSIVNDYLLESDLEFDCNAMPHGYSALHVVVGNHWFISRYINDIFNCLFWRGATHNVSSEVKNVIVCRWIERMEKYEEHLDSLDPMQKKVRWLKLLIKHGADVNCINEFGDTPLSVACRGFCYAEFIDVLCSNGANVNAQGKLGYTPLHHAAEWSESSSRVKQLLGWKADPNIRNIAELIPIQTAFNTFLKYPENEYQTKVKVNLFLQGGTKLDICVGKCTVLEDLVKKSLDIHLYDVIWSLHLAGGNPSVVRKLLMNSTELELELDKKHMLDAASNPSSLTILCRHCIRSQFTHFNLVDIDKLPLPKDLLSFLDFSDFSIKL